MSNNKYYMDGFITPPGVDDSAKVATIQRRLGIEDDGIWGPQTEYAYRNYMNAMSRSPKPTSPDPRTATAALTSASLKSGRTFGSTGYTADTFMKPKVPEAYSNLTNVSKAYGKTFGNPGYTPAQAQTTPLTPKHQAEALTNASIGHGRTFGSPGFTESYMKNYLLGGAANNALTDVSKLYGKTFGNPGYAANYYDQKTKSSPNSSPQISPNALFDFKKRELIGLIDGKMKDSPFRDRLKTFALSSSSEQVTKLVAFISQTRDIETAFNRTNWEKTMREVLSGTYGSASVVRASAPNMNIESLTRPHIDYPEDFDSRVSFSYYYYDNGLYYTDIYRNGELSGRISLGPKLPKMVKLAAIKSTWVDDLNDQAAMLAGIYARGAIEMFINSGGNWREATVDGLPGLSDDPYISDGLDWLSDSLLPTSGVDNYNENTIIVTANSWDLKGERTIEQLLLQK